jgi:hypothetical protein
MHSDIEYVVNWRCEVGDGKSEVGSELLPAIRNGLGKLARQWTCTMIGRELATRFRVEAIGKGEKKFHGLAIRR